MHCNMTAALHIFLQHPLKGDAASPCLPQQIELFRYSTDLVAIEQRNKIAMEILKEKGVREYIEVKRI